MQAADRVSGESAIGAALARGASREALELTVSTYGPEVLSFLAAVHGNREDAAEVFAQASADLVSSLCGFRGECSMRTWFYALARNASRRYFADPLRRRQTGLTAAEEVEQPIRTVTATFLRTEWKNKFRKLRDRLDPEDRTLLVLRVDRSMSWDEIAHVLAEPGISAATLRKRFERLKATLRAHAIDLGFPISEG